MNLYMNSSGENMDASHENAPEAVDETFGLSHGPVANFLLRLNQAVAPDNDDVVFVGDGEGSPPTGGESPRPKPKRPIPELIPISFASATNNNSIKTENNNENNMALNLSIKKSDSPPGLMDGQPPFGLGFSNDQTSSESERNSPVSLTSNTSSLGKLGKKSNSSFYEKLKEKLGGGLGDPDKLECRCGHVSKCLSESILHKKSCEGRAEHQDSNSLAAVSSMLSSSRCQYCRHRCKSSVDLMLHQQTCKPKFINNSVEKANNHVDDEDDEDGEEEESMDEAMVDNPNEPHPMENIVFVWNNIMAKSGLAAKEAVNDKTQSKKDDDTPQSIEDDVVKDDDGEEDGEEGAERKNESQTETVANQYYAIETAPGYGEVTKEIKSPDEVKNFSLKRVFKCPQCPFWASTASRFHVHIVGHLNQKPFECSLCAYRSNWRWDITKHIRLKTIRDPNHETAKVLMNDETGRRNYTKYNKYITLMKVTAENNESKFLKSGEMNQDEQMMMTEGEKRLKRDFNISVSSASQSPSPPTVQHGQQQTQPQQLTMNSSLDTTGDEQSHSLNLSMNVVEAPGDKKRTNFKCKKCNFK